MRRIAPLAIVLSLVLSLGLVSFNGSAQNALEQLAKQQISQKTGINPNLIATLFVTKDQDQFVLAFVYINQAVMQSKLKPELKTAIAPFVGQKALLTLVVPTRRSFFSPLKLSFQQGALSYLIAADSVHPVADKFEAGFFEANTVRAGVILLPSAIDISQPWQITYDGSFSTTFSLSEAPAAQPPQNNSPLPARGFLFLLLQFILLFFLLPFLV
ncbi:MAG TPA: hypothetical protein ENI60_03750 [Candidatus Fraserbacteria bacterium]|nr:hypothetical protein [Candidatus Fraserbacteria bacterium]